MGAGHYHHAELDNDVYGAANIYVDSTVTSKEELKSLQHPIAGAVGDVMEGLKTLADGKNITIFQSLGNKRT